MWLNMEWTRRKLKASSRKRKFPGPSMAATANILSGDADAETAYFRSSSSSIETTPSTSSTHDL